MLYSSEPVKPYFMMVHRSNFRVRLNASRVPKNIVGLIALYKWCGHNWFEIRILSPMDSSGQVHAEFLIDGQVIQIRPLYENVVFGDEHGSFVDARLGAIVMDSLLRPLVYCGCHHLIDPDGADAEFEENGISDEEDEEDEEEDDEDDEESSSSSEGEQAAVGVIVPLSRSKLRFVYSEKAVVESRRCGIRHRAVEQGSKFAMFLDELDHTVILITFIFNVYIVCNLFEF